MATDESARRNYWTSQLEKGYEMVEQLLTFPVSECGERFASLEEAARQAGVEMLFSTSKIAGGINRVFYLRESLVEIVVAIGREMNARGWLLKIEDGFRSLEMQSALVRKPEVFDAILKCCIWEKGGELPTVEFMFRRAIVMVANIPKIGTHMSGSAIDISVIQKADGAEVPRGGRYLEISERTPMRSPYISPQELQNRLEITAVLESHGFMHFPLEFWHYNQGDAGDHILTGNPKPARYGPVNWDPATDEVSSVANVMDPLNPIPAIEAEIAAALQRRSQQGSNS